MKRDVFVTGGTGDPGRPLIEALLARGHTVRALTREAWTGLLPGGSVIIKGNALDPAGWMGQVAPADTFVHLVGTPHPNPAKAAQFQAVDLGIHPRCRAGCDERARPPLRLRERRAPCAGHARVHRSAKAGGGTHQGQRDWRDDSTSLATSWAQGIDGRTCCSLSTRWRA